MKKSLQDQLLQIKFQAKLSRRIEKSYLHSIESTLTEWNTLDDDNTFAHLQVDLLMTNLKV